MLQEAVKSEKIAQSLQEAFDCTLESGDKIQEATRHWNSNHPYTQVRLYVTSEAVREEGGS